MFAETVKRLKAWYLTRYGTELTNNKLAEQVTQRIDRRAYHRTIAAVEAGSMPAWDVATALLAIDAEWVGKNTIAEREKSATSA